MAKTMQEVIVAPDTSVKIITREVPTPAPGQVLIKVVVAGTNPKDWKVPMWHDKADNSGDDVAGTIAALGEGVSEFHVGDRVAAFHEMMTPDGAFAEYTIAWATTTFHIPEKTSFEEAATLPLAAMTAAVGLYLCLGLPEPWRPTLAKTPLVIYGGATAVGAFAIKFARASNIHPIIAVAGNGAAYVETLLDRSAGDAVVDYRSGDAATVSGIQAALAAAGASDVFHAFDAVSEKGSFVNVGQVLSAKGDGSKMAVVLPYADYTGVPAHVAKTQTMVGRVHENVDAESAEGKAGIRTGGREFGLVFYRLMTRALEQGWLTAHPFEVVPGGLGGVERGLKDLKAGKASAKKYVYRIAETEGL